jgi:hypothetical protein
VPRPKSYPERHLGSPEEALARFMERNPGCENLAVVASAEIAMADFAAYRSVLHRWKVDFDRRLDRALLNIEPPPSLPKTFRALCKHVPQLAELADRTVEIHDGYAKAQAFRALQLDPVPLAWILGDRKLVMGATTTWAASAHGVTLKALDMVLLAVATGLEKPTKDAGAYADRIDRWRKAMPRIRHLAKALESLKGPIRLRPSGQSTGP